MTTIPTRAEHLLGAADTIITALETGTDPAEALAQADATPELTLDEMTTAVRDETSPSYLTPGEREGVLHYLIGWAGGEDESPVGVRAALMGAFGSAFHQRVVWAEREVAMRAGDAR